MKQSDLILLEYSIRLSVRDPDRLDSDDHSFINLHPNMLALKGVVPNDWEWDNDGFILQPDTIFVGYKNGISFFGNSGILEISQSLGLAFGDDNELPELVVRYVASLAPDVFRLAGMEWKVSVAVDDPLEWIRKRFFRPEIYSDKWDQVHFIPMLRFVANDEIMNYSFYPQSITPTNQEDEENEEEQLSLGALCRLGYSQPDDDAELSRWVLDWRKHEETAVSNLKYLMGVEHGLE